MILGRPTTLWLALLSAATATVQVITIQVRPDLDAVAVATIIGSVSAFLAVVIAFVANQPPVVSPGDTITVRTPSGTPDANVVVGTPPIS